MSGDAFYNPVPVQNPTTVDDVLTILRRMEAKLDAQDKRVEDIEKVLGVGGRVEAKMDALDGRVEAKMDALDGRVEAKMDALDERASDIEKTLAVGGRVDVVLGKLDRRSSAAENMLEGIALLVDAVAVEVSGGSKLQMSRKMVRDALGGR
ncbi:MAG: hypothetical protein M1839_003661 [Geoglossum umbratile]|nr:MAG: hypothetical protein M1839_003661 [Geoglossum umbratile]